MSYSVVSIYLVAGNSARKATLKLMKTEYIIWGKREGSDKHNPLSEELLVSDGGNLRSMKHAEQVIALLEGKHKCFDCRVQVIDGSPIQWSKTVNA